MPFTGDNKEFLVNITEEEIEAMLDENSTICYNLLFKWLIPTFAPNSNITFFEFVTAWM